MTESREEKGKGKRDRLRVSEWERKNKGRGRQAKARMAKKPFIIRARFFSFFGKSFCLRLSTCCAFVLVESLRKFVEKTKGIVFLSGVRRTTRTRYSKTSEATME